MAVESPENVSLCEDAFTGAFPAMATLWLLFITFQLSLPARQTVPHEPSASVSIVKCGPPSSHTIRNKSACSEPQEIEAIGVVSEQSIDCEPIYKMHDAIGQVSRGFHL